MAKPTAGQLGWIIVIVLGVAALPFILPAMGRSTLAALNYFISMLI